MARDKGHLLECLRSIEHHVLPHKVDLMLTTGDPAEQLRYRFNLVLDEVRTAILQTNKLERVALQEGCRNILAVLHEEVEFGHRGA